jgi:hypothetical protein
MNRNFIKWIVVIGTLLLFIAGSAWADGRQGHGPRKDQANAYQKGPHKPDGHGRQNVYRNPPHPRTDPPKFHGRPTPPSAKVQGHGRPYVPPARPSYHGHHRPAPVASCYRPSTPRHHHRPAPPIVIHHPARPVVVYEPAPTVVYAPAPTVVYEPAPPQPSFGGFLFSAAISDPGFAFGFSISDRW